MPSTVKSASPTRSCVPLALAEDFDDAFTPSRLIRSSREIRDLPWLQGICTRAMPVNPSCRRGGRYSTRVFYHVRQPLTLVHWSAFLNSTMLPRRLCGIPSAFEPSADRRIVDEMESSLAPLRTTDAECPREEGAFVSTPPAHPRTHGPEGRARRPVDLPGPPELSRCLRPHCTPYPTLPRAKTITEHIALPVIMRDGPVQIFAHACVISRSCGSPAYASRTTRASAASVAFGPRTALPSSSVSPAPFTPEPVSRGGIPSRTQPLPDIVYPHGSVFAVPTHHILPSSLRAWMITTPHLAPVCAVAHGPAFPGRSVRKEGGGACFPLILLRLPIPGSTQYSRMLVTRESQSRRPHTVTEPAEEDRVIRARGRAEGAGPSWTTSRPGCTSAPRLPWPAAANPAHARWATAADTALPPAVAAVAFGAHTPLPSPPVSPALFASALLTWSDIVLESVEWGSRTPPYLSSAHTHASTTVDVSLRCAHTIPYHPPPHDAFLSTPHPAAAPPVARGRACPAEIWRVLRKEKEGMRGPSTRGTQSPVAPSSHSSFDGRRSEDVSTTHAIAEPAGRMGHACGARMILAQYLPLTLWRPRFENPSKHSYPQLYRILEPAQHVPFPRPSSLPPRPPPPRTLLRLALFQGPQAFSVMECHVTLPSPPLASNSIYSTTRFVQARGWLRLPDHLLALQPNVDLKSYAYLCVTSPGTSPEMRLATRRELFTASPTRCPLPEYFPPRSSTDIALT
ncbi:hypothetical protein C8R44DRAFT_883579 [Mycena epipterygia]|nr:hypothetical protein C8R44DRAFT_883579 [Mycena epipterygia]